MSDELSYWGGSTARDGRIRRLSATTFAELVARYINVSVQHTLTRKEFLALPERERNAKKDSAFISPCAYSYDQEGRRSDENAVSSVLAILDLDAGAFIRDFDENPEELGNHLYPFNFVAWRTASWTKENPRLKVAVELSPMHPSNHRRAVSFVASRIGAPSDFKGARESGVISQPQYRPVIFLEDQTSPVIASRVNGIALHLSDLPEIEPEEQELLDGRTYACDQTDNDEFFGLAYLPVAGLKPEDVREALNTLDPDCDYKQWISVVAALRHQFTDEDEAREAYEMFVEWSERGSVKFASRRECWSKWKSYQPYARGRAPITLRTLYRAAIKAGWDNRKVAQKLSKTIEEWFNECQDKEELILNGAKQIAGIPFKNALVETSLLKLWNRRIVALGGDSMDSTTLKSELARVRKEDKKAKAEAKKDETPAWLTPWVFCSGLDAYINLGTGVVLKPAAFDRTYASEMLPAEGEIPANGQPVMQPGAYALNILKILKVDDLQYNPTIPEDERVFVDKVSGKVLLNSYLHSSVPVADPEHAARAEALIRELVGYLIAEPHLREFLLDYLALQHQSPGVKIPWSFMIQSAPGAGKGTLGEILQVTLGHQNVKLISPNQMNSHFNEWAVNLVFGVFNEVLIPGERRDAVLNSIKPLISDPTISMNLKHRDGNCQTANTANYLALTNYKDAAHFTADDRRWCLCFSPIQTKAQAEALQKSNRFDEIRWLKTPEGASALRYFFLKRTISPDFPLKGHAPATRYKTEAVEASKNQLQITIEDMIDDNDSPLICDLAIHDGALKQLIRNPRDHAFIPRYLSLMGFERHSSKRVMLDGGQRGYIWIRTEKWPGGDPVRFLKKRLKEAPELDAEDDSDCEFE